MHKPPRGQNQTLICVLHYQPS